YGTQALVFVKVGNIWIYVNYDRNVSTPDVLAFAICIASEP
ncbi:hypothetical protein VCHENC02_5112, partial [Vibrio harveyi]